MATVVGASALVALPFALGPAATHRRQVLEAWSDGTLTPKERRMLRGLRDDLGVQVANADAIQQDAEGGSHRG